MKISKTLAVTIAALTELFLCTVTRASVQFVGTSGSYAASDSQLAGGQTLTDWTIELWVKPDITTSYQGLFNNTPVEPWKEVTMALNDQGGVGLLEAWPNSDYTVGSPSGSIPANQWTLVSVVGSPSGLLLYVNGVQKGSGPSPGQASFASTHSPNAVGAFSFGLEDYLTLPDAGFFQGYLADFRVWDRALPSNEILSHVTSEPAIDAVGLRNWIPFNETTGTQFHDLVSGITGTLNGATFSADSPALNRPQHFCDITFNKAIYSTGDIVTATDLRFGNPSPNAVPVEVKLWLRRPDGGTVPILNQGADGSLVFPVGFSRQLGPVGIFQVSAITPRGQYEISCRVLDPVTGEMLGEDLNPFLVQ